MHPLTNIMLIILLVPALLQAQTSDAQQPVFIEADSVEIREQQGTSIYRGNVKISRGSMMIKGDLIHIYNTQQGIEKIEVQGKPASFRQLNDAKEEISAQSGDMTYTADDGVLDLKQDAVLVQHQNRFTSQHIIYDTRKDIVQAGVTPDEKDTTTQPPPRVNITIKPKQSNSSTPPASTRP